MNGKEFLESKGWTKDSPTVGGAFWMGMVEILEEYYQHKSKAENLQSVEQTDNKMEIYLLEQDLNNGYDTYDSVVVIAENEDEARKIHPGGEYEQDFYDWVQFNQIDQIKVTHIGTATEEQKKGVLLASFNAG